MQGAETRFGKREDLIASLVKEKPKRPTNQVVIVENDGTTSHFVPPTKLTQPAVGRSLFLKEHLECDNRHMLSIS